MSDCTTIRNRLVDLQYGELDESLQNETRAHLADCAPCRVEYSEIQAFAATVSTFDVPAVDDGRIAAILDAAAAQRPLAQRILAALRYNLEPVERMFLPGFLSVATCFLTLAPIVFGHRGLHTISPMALLVCGVLWSSVYNSIIGAVLESSRNRHSAIRMRVVLYGVLLSMLCMHFFYLAGLRWSFLPPGLAAVMTLRLSSSLTFCSALALLVVGIGIGTFVARRSLPHMLLVLALYLAINLPGLAVFARSQVTLQTVIHQAVPIVLSGLLGLCLGHLCKELLELRQRRSAPVLMSVAGD